MREMPVGAVKVIRQIGAAFATFVPVGTEHEMINDQLTAPVEKIGQGFLAIRPFEYVILVDLHRRAALSASRWRVNSFSRVSKSFRATSHSASDTISRFNSVSASFILFFLRLISSVPHVASPPLEEARAARSCTRPGRSSSVVFGSSCQIHHSYVGVWGYPSGESSHSSWRPRAVMSR